MPEIKASNGHTQASHPDKVGHLDGSGGEVSPPPSHMGSSGGGPRCESCDCILRRGNPGPLCDPCAPEGTGPLVKVGDHYVRRVGTYTGHIPKDSADDFAELMEAVE